MLQLHTYSKLEAVHTEGLSRREVFKIIHDIALEDKYVVAILALAHGAYARRKFTERIEQTKIIDKGNIKPLVSRLRHYIDGGNLVLSRDEYFIVNTLFSSTLLPQGYRDKLKESLGYFPEFFKKSEMLFVCQVCGKPTNMEVCTPCITRVKSFLHYRRESFTIPINFINFNLDTGPNVSGVFTYEYMDWTICKIAGDATIYVELVTREIGMHQYPLPIPDYQRLIVA